MTTLLAEAPRRPATTDSCRLCAPLGACLAYRGVRGVLPLIHGSQGCATYARRFAIGHFREPLDIACTNFSEAQAVFGGEERLGAAITHVVERYQPEALGLATSCLSETIGEDVAAAVVRLRQRMPGLPPIALASTASYRGTHLDGWRAGTDALLAALAADGPAEARLAVLPPLCSCADLHELRRFVRACGSEPILLPDFSATLDAPLGRRAVDGTGVRDVAACTRASGVVVLGATLGPAGRRLATEHGREVTRCDWPLGLEACERFERHLTTRVGRPAARDLADEAGRLLDAYADGHKYCFQKRVAIIADEELAVALAGFTSEIGLTVALAASGGRLAELLPAGHRVELVVDDADHDALATTAADLGLDLVLGSSRCAPLARRLGVPLVRVGFPIHDRLGASRLATLGYRGTHDLFERIVNALIAHAQERDPATPMVM